MMNNVIIWKMMPETAIEYSSVFLNENAQLGRVC